MCRYASQATQKLNQQLGKQGSRFFFSVQIRTLPWSFIFLQNQFQIYIFCYLRCSGCLDQDRLCIYDSFRCSFFLHSLPVDSSWKRVLSLMSIWNHFTPATAILRVDFSWNYPLMDRFQVHPLITVLLGKVVEGDLVTLLTIQSYNKSMSRLLCCIQIFDSFFANVRLSYRVSSSPRCKWKCFGLWFVFVMIRTFALGIDKTFCNIYSSHTKKNDTCFERVFQILHKIWSRF